MKKIFLILAVFLIVGCSVASSAKTPVESYLSSYNNLEYEVLLDMEEVIKTESLSNTQSDLYRDILKKQYQDLKYEIISETYDGNEATVKCEITVYDYYSSEKKSAEVLKNDPTMFYSGAGEYDHDLYIDYKLSNLKSITDTISYNIEFKVQNVNDVWILNEVSEINLKKIHGIYDYEN